MRAYGWCVRISADDTKRLSYPNTDIYKKYIDTTTKNKKYIFSENAFCYWNYLIFKWTHISMLFLMKRWNTPNMRGADGCKMYWKCGCCGNVAHFLSENPFPLRSAEEAAVGDDCEKWIKHDDEKRDARRVFGCAGFGFFFGVQPAREFYQLFDIFSISKRIPWGKPERITKIRKEIEAGATKLNFQI